MATIQEMMLRAQLLRQETALDSISPERAGGIMYDTLAYINQMQLQGANPLLISKIYASVAAMEADSAPVSDLTGQALRPGQVVVIASADSDNGLVYRYNGGTESRWTVVGKIGNLTPVDSLDSYSTQLPLAANQGRVLDEKVYDLKQEIGGGFFNANGYVRKTDGTIGASSIVVCTEFLEISSPTIIVRGESSATAAMCAFYDANKAFISYYDTPNTNDSEIVITSIPDGAKFIRCTALVASQYKYVLFGEIVDLYAKIQSLQKRLTIDAAYTWVYGGISATGTESSSTQYMKTSLVDVSNYEKITVTNAPSFIGSISICKYLNGTFVERISADNVLKDASFDGVRIVVGKTSGNISNAEFETVKANILNHIPSSLNDERNYEKTLFDTLLIKDFMSWEMGGISSTGAENVSAQYARNPEIIDVSKLTISKLYDVPAFITNIFVAKYLNGVFVERVNINELAVDSTFNGVRYIVGTTNNMTSEQFSALSSTIKFDYYVSDLIGNMKSVINGKWFGKKMVSVGDSITYGYAPRNTAEYPGKIPSFTELAASALGMEIVNCGISGSFMQCKSNWGDQMFASYDDFLAASKDESKIYGVQNTYTSFTYYEYDGSSWVVTSEINNPMCLRASLLPEDADLVVIMGGTNDIRQGGILGTPTDTDVYSYYGALDVAYKALYKRYFIDSDGSGRKIIAIAPPKLLATPPTTSGGTGTLVDMSGYVEAVKVVAKRYGFQVLDFQDFAPLNPHLFCNLAGFTPGYTGNYYNTYVPDGTHPSIDGQKILADILIEAIN